MKKITVVIGSRANYSSMFENNEKYIFVQQVQLKILCALIGVEILYEVYYIPFNPYNTSIQYL